MLARVVGKHCESGDIVVRDAWLPGDVAPGDLLAVAATGAYCRSMASNYNDVPAPAGVAVRGGDSRVLVRRETEADLLALGPGMTDSTPEAAAGRAARLRRRRQRGRPAAAASSATTWPQRIGAPLELVGIAVRRPQRVRDLPVDPALFTTDAAALVARDDVDIVIEVIGGIEPARSLLRHRTRARRARGHRQQGAAGRGRRDAVRRRRGAERRPVLRGERRRRDPAAAPAARVAGRRPGHPRASASSTAPPTTS